MRAIVEASRLGHLHPDPVLILSDRPEAPGVHWARSSGLATAVADYRVLGRKAGEKTLAQLLQEAAPDWIALAGFMRILSPMVVHPYLGRMINIHPSLLPRHPGLDTYRRVLEAGEHEHGSTVHFVDETLDGGPRLACIRVPVLPEDDPERLAARTKTAERKLYPWVLNQLAHGILRWENGHAVHGHILLKEPIDATSLLAD